MVINCTSYKITSQTYKIHFIEQSVEVNLVLQSKGSPSRVLQTLTSSQNDRGEISPRQWLLVFTAQEHLGVEQFMGAPLSNCLESLFALTK